MLKEQLLVRDKLPLHVNLFIDSDMEDATEDFMLTLKTLKKTLWPLFMDGVQHPQGYSHLEEAVDFLPFSFQKFLVLISSTSEG